MKKYFIIILKFVLMFFVISINALADGQIDKDPKEKAEICEENRKEKQTVVNVNFDYDGTFLAIPGVKEDRKLLKEINKTTYGHEGVSFDDKVLDGESESIDAHNKELAYFYKFSESKKKKVIAKLNKYVASRKKRFLDKLKEQSLQSKDGMVLNISGHGVQCIDENDQISFCMPLPISYSVQDNLGFEKNCVVDKEKKIFSMRKCPHFFVTTKEFVENAKPKRVLIDTCHSGQMALDIQRINKSTVVVASSFAGDNASDGQGKGGKLIRALHALTHSSNSDLCKLDMDNDGEISVNESFLGILISEVHNIRENLKLNFDNIRDYGRGLLSNDTSIGEELGKLGDSCECKSRFCNCQFELECKFTHPDFIGLEEKIQKLSSRMDDIDQSEQGKDRLTYRILEDEIESLLDKKEELYQDPKVLQSRKCVYSKISGDTRSVFQVPTISTDQANNDKCMVKLRSPSLCKRSKVEANTCSKAYEQLDDNVQAFNGLLTDPNATSFLGSYFQKGSTTRSVGGKSESKGKVDLVTFKQNTDKLNSFSQKFLSKMTKDVDEKCKESSDSYECKRQKLFSSIQRKLDDFLDITKYINSKSDYSR